MSTPSVKICGLTRPQDVEAAIVNGASALGFIVECESPRALSISEAAKLSRPATGIAKRVAVTVNASDNLLDQICLHMQPDMLQLHGEETPERISTIKSVLDIPVIKAVPVRTKVDLDQAHIYAQFADYILLDAQPPKDTTQRGGHGRAFDWTVLEGFHLPVPYVLAGGLSPFNIKTAIQKTDAKIFDVSSGVEARAGVKDHALIAQLMRAIHT